MPHVSKVRKTTRLVDPTTLVREMKSDHFGTGDEKRTGFASPPRQWDEPSTGFSFDPDQAGWGYEAPQGSCCIWTGHVFVPPQVLA